MKTIWNALMDAQVKGMLDGKQVKLTRREAHILSFLDKSQKSSSAKGASLPLEFDIKMNGLGDDEAAAQPLSPADEASLAMLQQILDAGFAGMEPLGGGDRAEDAEQLGASPRDLDDRSSVEDRHDGIHNVADEEDHDDD